MATAQTQADKILAHFQKGHTLTTKQAYTKFGVTNLGVRVNQLRARGFSIYTNGNSYRLGVPSRAMIATAYKAAGASLFA
jgi:hypothetical protein